MILGLGTDLCHAERIKKAEERFGERFLQRVFSKAEQEQALTLSSERRFLFYAKRFAAKEAFAKALGTGVRFGIRLAEIEVYNDSAGKPCLRISGRGKFFLDKMPPQGCAAVCHLSLTDEFPYVLATVIISAKPASLKRLTVGLICIKKKPS